MKDTLSIKDNDGKIVEEFNNDAILKYL